jgi:glycosyltransferase involved in cell wall biosynthesis
MSIFEDIAKHRMHIHIYVSRHNEDYKSFSEKSEFIHYHGHLTPKILLQEMTKYDFGWAGFNATKNRKHLDVTLPNKLFEYIACGLPVLSFPHRTQKQIIEEHGLGFVFHDIEELVELLNTDLVYEIRETVLKKRYDFTIEENIGSVKDFYEKILN